MYCQDNATKLKNDFFLCRKKYTKIKEQPQICIFFYSLTPTPGSFFWPWPNIWGLDLLFPVLTIKVFHRDMFYSSRIQTVRSDTVSIWIRPRRVKALHPTRSTEGVLRLVCIKRVCGQIVFALYESELWFRNNEVLVLLFVTNGTIAVVHNKPFWRQNFKSDGIAMAAASVECVWCCHGS